MYYRLCIMKVEANPAFDQAAFDEWQERQRTSFGFNSQPYAVPAEHGTRMLEVVVTSEEYQRIKEMASIAQAESLLGRLRREP